MTTRTTGELEIKLHWADTCSCGPGGCPKCESITIVRADPHIQIRVDLYRDFVAHPNEMRWVEWAPDREGIVHGSLVHIDDGTQHFIYRITGWDRDSDCFTASWPD